VVPHVNLTPRYLELLVTFKTTLLFLSLVIIFPRAFTKPWYFLDHLERKTVINYIYIVRVAATFVSAMQYSGRVGVITVVLCLPLIRVDRVECHPANGPSMTGLLSWVSVICKELSFYLTARSCKNLILFIFTRSEPLRISFGGF
jgi:hypothetical protein